MEGKSSRSITTTPTTINNNNNNNNINGINRHHLSGMSGWKRYRDNFLSRRLTRAGVFVAFIIFSPIILPLFCLCCPFICLVAVLLHLVPIKWRFQWGEGGRNKGRSIVRCKETKGSTEARAGLLERYLEDQLGLVVDTCFGSMD